MTHHKIELFISFLCLFLILLIPGLGVMIAFLIVIIYLVAGKDRADRFRSIGFNSPPSWKKAVAISLGLAVLIELSFQVIINPLIEILTSSKIDLSAYEQIAGNVPFYVMMLVVGWVAGGIIEEILFRGFLLTRISSLFGNINTGNIIGIIITSGVFGFSHLYQGWSGVISTGLIAVILGIIFIRSNKILWIPILTHGFINTIALTLMFFELDEKLNGLLF